MLRCFLIRRSGAWREYDPHTQKRGGGEPVTAVGREGGGGRRYITQQCHNVPTFISLPAATGVVHVPAAVPTPSQVAAVAPPAAAAAAVLKDARPVVGRRRPPLPCYEYGRPSSSFWRALLADDRRTHTPPAGYGNCLGRVWKEEKRICCPPHFLPPFLASSSSSTPPLHEDRPSWRSFWRRHKVSVYPPPMPHMVPDGADSSYSSRVSCRGARREIRQSPPRGSGNIFVLKRKAGKLPRERGEGAWNFN